MESTRLTPESSVLDPDTGSGAFLTPGSGIRDVQKIKIRIRGEHIFWVKVLKFLDADSIPGSRNFF
jgi:hypothetical protein